MSVQLENIHIYITNLLGWPELRNKNRQVFIFVANLRVVQCITEKAKGLMMFVWLWPEFQGHRRTLNVSYSLKKDFLLIAYSLSLSQFMTEMLLKELSNRKSSIHSCHESLSVFSPKLHDKVLGLKFSFWSRITYHYGCLEK